ncbi:TIGR04086 family membrane protein [Shimazuella kribbensis]|uniref:TIGR04086 family membrane protein n=1 Tax=Shimazuella kribbensis TaxID=139808 RepID=UPI0003FA418E|nr:TIGR04086 family membrane protein [Shimazuella kribbensis]
MLKETLRTGWHSPMVAGQMILWAFIFVLSLITALFLRFSSLETSSLPTITFCINAVSLLSAGFISGKRSGKKGWYYGGLQGIIYTLLIWLVAFLAFDTSMRVDPLIFGIFAFGIGALGGIFGVNTAR